MANNIALVRIKYGVTQKELAKKLGMHTHALSYAECNKCGVETAKAVAEAFGENVFYVLGEDALKLLPKTEEDFAALQKTLEGLK